MKLVKIHFIFLLVALLIAFILIPLDQYYFDKQSAEEIRTYIQGGITFQSFEVWKRVFTWFLGLTCGRLMIRALMRQPSADKKKHN